MHKITKAELFQAQVALLVAIALQIVVWRVNHGIFYGSQAMIIGTELMLVFVIAFTINKHTAREWGLHHNLALALLALISAANISALAIVLHMLIVGTDSVSGLELLSSAVAIFITNIIVYALWYWEIDSPGLTRKRWTKRDKDFQFIQQDLPQEFPDWKPQFLDYLYLASTNAVNFAASDTRPLTHAGKLLMGSQALVSVFTLAIVVARSVSILGA